jgi:hypothetical protein
MYLRLCWIPHNRYRRGYLPGRMYRNLSAEHLQFYPNCFINVTDLLHNKPLHLTQICYLSVKICEKYSLNFKKNMFCSIFFFLIRVLVHMWDNDNNEEQTKILHYLLRVTTVIDLKMHLMTDLMTNFIQKEENCLFNFSFGSWITHRIIEMLKAFIHLK